MRASTDDAEAVAAELAACLAAAAAPEVSSDAGLQAAHSAAECAARLQRRPDQGRAGALICTHLMRQGRHADMLAQAREVMPLLASPELMAHRRELLRCMTVCASEIGAFDVALDAAHELVLASQGQGQEDAALTAAYALAVCLERMGDSWQAVRLLGEALEAYGKLEASRPLLMAANALCAISVGMAHRSRGAASDAEEQETWRNGRRYGELALAMLQRVPDAAQEVAVSGNLGEIRLMQGEIEAAQPLLQHALALALTLGLRAHTWRVRTSLADWLLASGQAVGARDAAIELLAEMGPSPPQQTAMRAHAAAYRACRALHQHELALVHLEAVERMERLRTTAQLRAQSQLFVTRTEARQARLQAEHARADAVRHRERAAEFAAAAERDPLTGLGNRRHLDRRCAELLPAAERDALPLSLALIDIDHFKAVNDQHGHAVGDQVLVVVAQLLRENTRLGDVIARHGGEEFVIVLPGMDCDAAVEVCERLRERVLSHPWALIGGPEGGVTISIGLTCAPPLELRPLMHRADQALYAAKRGGRNRVHLRAS